MTDSLIESVARALCLQHYREVYPNAAEYDVGANWLRFMKSARAAIEAMRLPTEAMVAQADDAYDQCTDTGDFFGFIWKAMIDAALSEGE